MESKATFIYKRVFDTESIESFKKKLSETDSQETESYENSDEAYAIFLQQLIIFYDNYFAKRNIKVKVKDLESPWITRGIKKSSKHSQRLNEKFLKILTKEKKLDYKIYKKLFESAKKH